MSDDQLPLETFSQLREEVLGRWPTGQEARNLHGNGVYLSKLPHFATEQLAVNRGLRKTLVQPRCGVVTVRDQLRLFQIYKSVGADILSYQVDSHTRNSNYTAAAEAIRESEATGVPTINGFPIVNHGVSALRRVMADIRTPLQTP